jgi:hypothetical protein
VPEGSRDFSWKYLQENSGEGVGYSQGYCYRYMLAHSE